MPSAEGLFLVLVRHGEAGRADRDSERELTQAGRDALRKLGAQLILNEFIPAAIRSSPLVRALQTAEILQGALGSDIAMDATQDLGSGATPESLLSLLRAEEAGSTVIWVGHMPDLGRFASVLLGVPEDGVEFKAGAALGLDVDLSADPPTAVKKWAWPPA